MAQADLPIYANVVPRPLSVGGLSIREDVLFTDAKGQESDRSRKKAEKLLEDWRGILSGVLEPNEMVFHIVKNCQAPVSALEQFMLGWHAYGVTATMLVLTNLRILHLGLTGRGKWKRVLKSVRWGDVTEAKVKGWIGRTLDLKYASGKKDRYWKVPGRDGRKIKDIVAAVLPASRGEATPAQEMTSLCPDCRNALTPRNYRCKQCGLGFKDEKTLLKWTLLIPGGGYLYSGFIALGIISVLVEGVFTLEAILYVLMAAGFVQPSRMQDGSVPARADLWITAAVFAVIAGLNKTLEYLHGRRVIRTFLPLKKSGQA